MMCAIGCARAAGGQAAEEADGKDTAYGALLGDLKRNSWDDNRVRQLAGVRGFRTYDGNPVLAPGPPGSWDAGAIGSMTVVIVDGVYHMYYEAWGVLHEQTREEDYDSLQIGHALSSDGVHWLKDPANPVLPKGAQGEWDANGTWDPYVIYQDGVFKLWYGGGIHPRCDWGYAESSDGRHFVKRGRISQLNHVEDDHVVYDSDARRYYMYYWDRQHEPQGLFRAESPDERHFDFRNAIPLKIEREDPRQMYKFTHVLKENSVWFMLYADFVRPNCPESTTRLAFSRDGVHWSSANKNLLAGHDTDVVKHGDSLYLAYFGPRGHFDQKDSDVRVALYSGSLDDLIKEPE
jgi:hypothetical protein